MSCFGTSQAAGTSSLSGSHTTFDLQDIQRSFQLYCICTNGHIDMGFTLEGEPISNDLVQPKSQISTNERLHLVFCSEIEVPSSLELGCLREE